MIAGGAGLGDRHRPRGQAGVFLTWSGEFVHFGRVTVHEDGVVAPECIEPLSGVLWDGPADPRGLIL